MRITKKHLTAKVALVNAQLGYTEPTIGSIRLYGAYGGTAVHQLMNQSGGVNALSELGTMRETARFLDGMLAVLRMERDEA